jgi:transcriptional regulator with XRE-family HTH domain
MAVRQTPAARGAARGRAILADLCREAESARLELGLSYADLGRALHLSDEQVARICRGQSPKLSVVRAAQLLSAVGRDLSARAYPGGLPIRDAAHLALQSRVAEILAPALRVGREVPVVGAGSGPELAGGHDRRAWDLVVEGSGWRIGVEAETRLNDLQAVLRRVHLKQRDGSVDAVILLVNKTAHNRRVLEGAGVALRDAFPASPRVALARLRAGTAVGENVLLVL